MWFITFPMHPANKARSSFYHALAQEFGGKLDAAAAERGLVWFAEHVADAEANPGKHPNIDLLFKVKAENASLTLKPLAA